MKVGSAGGIISNSSCFNNTINQNCVYLDGSTRSWYAPNNLTANCVFKDMSLGCSGEYTYSGWVRVTGAITSNFVFIGTGTSIGWAIRIDQTDNLIRFVNDGTFSTLSIANTEINNKWIMITITSNVTQMCMYVNATYRTCTGTPRYATNNNFSLGGVTEQAGNELVGYLDDWSFFNRSLNESEITQLFNSGSGLVYSTVSLISPSNNNQTTNNTIDFNFTCLSSFGLANASLYLNNILNYTKIFSGETTLQSVNKTLTLGEQNYSYNWTGVCYDNLSSSSWASSNYSLIIDTIPNGTIDNPTDGNSLDINISINLTDANLNYCYYNITDAGGTEKENTILNCSNLTDYYTLSKYSTFVIRLFINDSRNHQFYTTKTFYISSLGGDTGGGGGGSVSLVTVIALQQINGTTERTGLDRAKLYSSIRKYCNLYSLYENTCKLSSNDFSNLSNDLEKKAVDIDEYLLLDYIKYFDENKVEEIKVEESIAEKFELFKATLEILEQPLIISGVIDKFWFINLVGNEVEIIVRPNKPLKSCQVIGEIGWSCNFTNSFATLSYKLPNSPDFSFRRITAQVSFTSDDGENVFKDAQLRAIYFTTKQLFIYGFSLLSIIALTGLIFRKKIKLNYFKNKFKKIW